MKAPHRRQFMIVYGTLLLVCPTFVFGFVFVGTLPIAAWIVFALKSGGGDVGPIFPLQIGAWIAIEALIALAFATLVASVSASMRRSMLLLGGILALIAATRPIYCYQQGVNESVGACTNAIAALWSRF